MFEKFARAARTAVDGARHEAERRGDRRIGTDHLLIALLDDATVAQTAGVDAKDARRAAEQLDREALAAIGIRLADWQPDREAAPGRRVLFMTAGAKAVIRRTLALAQAERAPAITTRHLLLAVLDQHDPDPSTALLAALPVDQAALRLRLAAGRPGKREA
jgi:ATP-dependent Clp protease ATP-binding subunit ClpA